jgi:hypothetical protein
MSAEPVLTLGIPGFDFDRNLPFLSGRGSLGFKVAGRSRADAALALMTSRQPFPEGDIDFSDVRLEASTPQPIVFSRSESDKISFTASGSAFAGFGFYRSAAALIKRLPAAQDNQGREWIHFITPSLDFGRLEGQALSCIRWGFDGQAKGSGSVALGAVGSATLALEAGTEGLFAVIRQLPGGMPARSVVQETADSWLMSRQVRDAAALRPGTWLLSEVMGRISVAVSAEAGYDLTWVRESAPGVLTGDVGLRLRLGASARVGFKASGHCAVVLSREAADPVLRLRVIRLASRQLDIAAGAGAFVKPVDTLPGAMEIDDFVRAVFGVHGEQVIRDLEIVEQWTAKDQSLSKLLESRGLPGAERLIAAMAGVEPGRLQDSYDLVHARVVGLIKQWRDLPHSVSSMLLKLMEEKLPMDKVRELAAPLVTGDPDAVRNLLAARLGDPGFSSSVEGRVLEAVAEGPVLNLLSKADLPGIGSAILGILDGGALEAALTSLVGFVVERLDPGQILNATEPGDFGGIEQLLQNKLAVFLGRHSLAFQDLDKIRDALRRVLLMRQEYFEKAMAALQEKYTLEFTQKFQNCAAGTALLDATFDFSDPANSAHVSDLLAKALAGDFDAVFTERVPGVKLGLAELSHGVARHAHTDVTLPFLRFSSDHDNHSLATAKVRDLDGRVIAYTLDSNDAAADNHRSSILALSMAVAAKGCGSSRVRVFQDKADVSYSLIATRRGITRKELSNFVQPFAARYFPNTISKVDAWTGFLGQRTEEEIPDRSGCLGNALINLSVNLDPASAKACGAAWLALAADRNDERFARISFAIQRALKDLIPQVYFKNADRYHDKGPAEVLMAYAAMPAVVDPAFRPFPYWDAGDPGKVRAVLNRNETAAGLRMQLRRALAFVGDTGDAQFYRVDDAARMLSDVDPRDPRLRGLLFVESEIVLHSFEAAMAIAKFGEAARQNKPTDAVRALANYGAKLTEALNKSLVNFYVGDSVRALGIELFLAASAAIGGPNDPKRRAMLSVEFMRPGLPFNEPVLKQQGRLNADQIALAERLVSI